MTRLAVAILLVGCTGSPDAVTVYGGRNQAAYDTAGGAPAFDEVGYSYGLALTWNLPTTRSARQDSLWAEQMDLLRSLERDAHDANLHSGAATVTVETGGEKHEPENSITAQTKTILGLVAAALAAALIPVVKKIGKNRKRIETLEKQKHG